MTIPIGRHGLKTVPYRLGSLTNNRLVVPYRLGSLANNRLVVPYRLGSLANNRLVGDGL
jgi:hypothetical protein